MKKENPKTNDGSEPFKIGSLDSKITSLAVGELPKSERMEIESLLENDEIHRAEFEEIRATADLLAKELKSEPAPKLTEEEKQRIRETVGAAPRFPAITQPSVIARVSRYAAFGAIAAGLAVATVTLLNLDHGRQSVAVNEAAPPLSDAESIAQEKRRATQQVAQLESAIDQQRKKVDKARVDMLEAMEELKVADLSSGAPSWARSEKEAESGSLVSTGYHEAKRNFESARDTQTALEEKLTEAKNFSLLAGGPDPDGSISRYKSPETLSIAEEPSNSLSPPEMEAPKSAPVPAESKMSPDKAKAEFKAKTASPAPDAPIGINEIAKNQPTDFESDDARVGGASIEGASIGGAGVGGDGAGLAAEESMPLQSANVSGTADKLDATAASAAVTGPAATPSVTAGMKSPDDPFGDSADESGFAGKRNNMSRGITFGKDGDSERAPAPGAGIAQPKPDQPADMFSQPDTVQDADRGTVLTRDQAQKELAVVDATLRPVKESLKGFDGVQIPDLEGLPPEKKKDLADSYGVTVDELGGHIRRKRLELDDVLEDAGKLNTRKQELEEFLRRPPALDPSNEDYGKLKDNPFISAWDENFSTFSVDVDTASYANVRRFVATRNQLPPKDAVRIEEMINYFDYDYPQPQGEHPFAVTTEIASCPWAPDHRLLRVGLKGKEMFPHERPPMNLVFLIDVSGSMESQNKLPLLKTSMKHLVNELAPRDRVAMVVYAGKAGLVLDATSGDRKDDIKGAIERLQSGGSTAGGAGIKLAYKVAKENHIKGGVNRVILATDGDFNVGDTDTGDLTTMVMNRSKSDGTFLTILGFGEGNLKESRMEQIANNGNGEYYYIDSEKEGRRVLVDKLNSTLVTIAKDVKIQIDFNPGQVGYYRLIGYANRLLHKRDFDDDRKDAGEIGAGHTVTALYEIIPAGVKLQKPHGANPTSRYLADAAKKDAGRPDPKKARKLIDSPELLTVKLRYKQPEGKKSTLLEVPLEDLGRDWAESTDDFRFAAAVAGYGMMLRESPYRGSLNYDHVLELAVEGARLEDDPHGLRSEFIEMVKTTARLTGAR